MRERTVTFDPVNDDVRKYGRRATQIILDCKRCVALASDEEKLGAFRDAARTLGDAVAGQWLDKNRAGDVAQEIAVAHNYFGLAIEGVQQIVADIIGAAHIPVIQLPVRPQRRQLISHRASDLQPEKLVWVWPGRVAEGKLVMFGGPPGLGKSQLTILMAATISNGGDWPCNEGAAVPGNVIIMSAEDGIEDTIIPRLIAAGANMERVHVVAAVTKSDGTGRKTFSLKADVDLLEEKAKQIGNVRLIIIDPISAYMGGSDGNNNVETRETLEPISDMANRLRTAVVAVTHLNKSGAGGKQNAINRFAGSIAFVAAARAAFAVIEDLENEGRRLLLQAKNNLGPNCKGLAFRMDQRLIAGDIPASSVFFENEHVDHSIDEALAASETQSDAKASIKEDVIEFLSEILANGPVDVLEVERQARAAALLADDRRLNESKPFRQARKHLGAISDREGFGPGSRHLLRLPSSS
jgi:RecA-family ATPase